MSSYLLPSINAGPLYGRPSFNTNMFEYLHNVTVLPSAIQSITVDDESRFYSYRGWPFNTQLSSYYVVSQLPLPPGVLFYTTVTGAGLERDAHGSMGSTPVDSIIASVVISNSAPGGLIAYRFYVITTQYGIVYDTGTIYTSLSTCDFRITLRMWGDLGGYCNVQYILESSALSLSISNNINNYGYPNNLYTYPDDWRMRIYGGNNLLISTNWNMIVYNTVSRVDTPSGIVTSESFGFPSISTVPSLGVSPFGIASQEGFGYPIVSVNSQLIYPNSIASQCAMGIPQIVKTTTPKSALPPAEASKIGDIRLKFDQEDQYGELIIADRDVDRDLGFETAVLITLGTDKYADDEDELPDDSGYRGGWWGDSIPVVADYKMGTKLWLLQRAKTEAEIPAIAKEYLIDGFKWMKDDGIVSDVIVNIERRRDLKTTLAFTLSFIKPEGKTIFYKFFYNWEAQILRRA